MPTSEQPLLRTVLPRYSTSRAIFALVLREISTSYGRSPGGYLWAILEPAAGIALLTLIFSIGFRHPPLGTNFALFYASGMLPFLMYADIAGKISQSIPYSRTLLVYPRVTFIDAMIARLLLNTLSGLVVQSIVIGFILIVMRPDTMLDIPRIGLAYLMAVMLAIGIGTLNGFLSLTFPLWSTAWSILMRPLFLVSCIFFIFESVPQPYSDYLWFNPLVHIVGEMRAGYYPFYHPTYVSIVYPVAISAVTCMAGLFLLYRYHRDILNK